MPHPNRRTATLLVAAACVPLVACAQKATVPPPGPDMTPSVTYLHLLAKTPFYTALTNEQLQWVIDHSREWVVVPGAEIASNKRGTDSIWVLLDGGWQVEHAGRTLPAGHADPAKWFGGRDMLALGMRDVRVVATKRSYVMQIEQAELDEMLRKGIPFRPHLDMGLAFYRGLIP